MAFWCGSWRHLKWHWVVMALTPTLTHFRAPGFKNLTYCVIKIQWNFFLFKKPTTLSGYLWDWSKLSWVEPFWSAARSVNGFGWKQSAHTWASCETPWISFKMPQRKDLGLGNWWKIFKKANNHLSCYWWKFVFWWIILFEKKMPTRKTQICVVKR